jgi:hypothetical protein
MIIDAPAPQNNTRLHQAAAAVRQQQESLTHSSSSSSSSMQCTSEDIPSTFQTPVAAPVSSSVMTATTAHLLLAAGSAAAAKIEVDVPDFLVENNPLDAVLHSPVLAIGAAVLALLLFPKLIRVAINYLIYPVIVALLAYLAISHPEQTANSIYVLLEFIKDHPAASSVAVVVAAGVLLGPDILAGTALAGAWR